MLDPLQKNDPSFFNIFTPQKTHANTHPLWFLWILIGWKPSTSPLAAFGVTSSRCSIPWNPIMERHLCHRRVGGIDALGNELEIGLLSCFFFLGGDMGQSCNSCNSWICNYEKTLSKNAFASARRSVRSKKGWVELCCCTYVMVPFVHSTILFEDRYLHEWVECFIKCMQIPSLRQQDSHAIGQFQILLVSDHFLRG